MQILQKQHQSQKIFNNQFVVIKKISAGSFGVVFLGYDQVSKQEVALKVEKEENEEVKSLEREVEIVKRLDGTDGFPKFYWAGEDNGYNVLALQLLGKDLSFYFKLFKKFTLKTTITIGMQAVLLLEKAHIKGVVHRDLKPENVILGVGKEAQKLYLIDFGISKVYRDSNNRHISFKDQKSFLGTTRYASIAAHKGFELGRKDDLESTMYILLYFLKGQLPWQNMVNVTDEERTKKVGELKEQLQGELFKDQPPEFQRIFEKLQFKNEPNYKMILNEFRKAAENAKIVLDGAYEWTEIKQSTHMTVHTETQHNSRNNIQPSNSNDMKKSIEKQLSGLNQMGSNNLLAPPPVSSRNNTFVRDDIRKVSNISMQSSIAVGTHNSMFPKYQPSIIENQFLKRQASYDEQSYQWNFGNEIDENDNEESLYVKYHNLKKSTKIRLFPNMPGNYN